MTMNQNENENDKNCLEQIQIIIDGDKEEKESIYEDKENGEESESESDNKEQPKSSEHYETYKRFLLEKGINLESVQKQDLLEKLSQTSEIRIDTNDKRKEENHHQIVLENIETKNENVKTYTLRLGNYVQKIVILIESKNSPFHDKRYCRSGCFGNVYNVELEIMEEKCLNENQIIYSNIENFTIENNNNSHSPNFSPLTTTNFAIKCIPISPSNPAWFIFHLREYFILKLLSSLSIGPKCNKIFGFDMILWRDCIEFTMETCEYLHEKIRTEKELNECFLKLSEKLYKMHLLQLVHVDIKLENIMYSEELHEPVFIDFGCSKLITEPMGKLSETEFTGTYEYSSPEMKEVFFAGKGMVDMYYNDFHALKYAEEKVRFEMKYMVDQSNEVSQRESSFSISRLSMSQEVHDESEVVVEISNLKGIHDIDKNSNNKVNKTFDKKNNHIYETKILQFKYYLTNYDIDSIHFITTQLLTHEPSILSITLYLSTLKPTYQLRKIFESSIHPYLIKLKEFYLNKIFTNTNITKISDNKFTNVFELVEYLERVFIKGGDFIGGEMFMYSNGIDKIDGCSSLLCFLNEFESISVRKQHSQVILTGPISPSITTTTIPTQLLQSNSNNNHLTLFSSTSIKNLFNNNKHSTFSTFYHSLYSNKNNIEHLKTILTSIEAIKTIHIEYYYLVYLYCLDFSHELRISIEEKSTYAKVFCEFFYESNNFRDGEDIFLNKKRMGDINNSDSSTFTKHSTENLPINNFSHIKQTLLILLHHCTSEEHLTEFKLLSFSTICTQLILIHSIDITSEKEQINEIINLQSYCSKWLKKLIEDDKYSFLTKYSEVYKLVEAQFLLEATDFAIFDYELLAKEEIELFLEQMGLAQIDKEKSMLDKEQELLQEHHHHHNHQTLLHKYYTYLIKRSYEIDPETHYSQQLKVELEKHPNISPQLKTYLTKMLEINLYATEILLDQHKSVEKIIHFEEILEAFYLQAMTGNSNQNFTNKNNLNNNDNNTISLLTNCQLFYFVFKCKIFKLSIKIFQYQKAKRVLESITEQVNCTEITNKMFLIERCTMLEEQSLERLGVIVDNLHVFYSKKINKETREGIQESQESIKINEDFIFDVIKAIKYSFYNEIMPQSESLLSLRFKQFELKIFKYLKHVTFEYINKFIHHEKRLYYHWLDTLYRYFHMTHFYKKEALKLYSKYFKLTEVINYREESKMSYLFSEMVWRRVEADSVEGFLEIVEEYEIKLLGRIEKFLETRSENEEESTKTVIESLPQPSESQSTITLTTTTHKYLSSYKELEFQSLSNIYFKSVILILQMANYLNEWNKKESLCVRLAEIAEKHQHYISFYEGYSVIYDVLEALTNWYLSNEKNLSELLLTTKEKRQEEEEKLWTFIYRICEVLHNMQEKDFELSLIRQLEQYFSMIKLNYYHLKVTIANENNLTSKMNNSNNTYKEINTNLDYSQTLLINSDQNEDILILTKRKELLEQLAKFYFHKSNNIKIISIQKHNSLLLFQILTLDLYRFIEEEYFDYQQHKKLLWKITNCLHYLKPIFKNAILGKYYCLFINNKNSKKNKIYKCRKKVLLCIKENYPEKVKEIFFQEILFKSKKNLKCLNSKSKNFNKRIENSLTNKLLLYCNNFLSN